MRLVLRNIGKINEADIELNGITVFAGENCTGKSTVGKALYGLLSAFYKLDRKIEEQKRDSISHDLYNLLSDLGIKGYNALSNANVFPYLIDAINGVMKVFLIDNKSLEVIEDSIYKVIVSKLVAKVMQGANENEKGTEVIHSYSKTIAALDSITDEQLYPVFANRSIGGIFQSQVNHINNPSSEALLKMEYNGELIEVRFINNSSSYVQYSTQDIPEPVYIDSVFTLEEHKKSKSSDTYNSSLSQKLYEINENLSSELDEVIYNKKIEKTLKFADEIALGEILLDNDTDKLLVFKDNRLTQPLKMANLSLGLKSFAIVKRLLKNRQLTETTVLIIDEPETHLHPEWQLKFAELLVSMQKDLNLTIMLATHSPYFLNSIEVFSAKYGIADKCKYYLAKNDKNGVCADVFDVTADTESVYSKLGAPLQTLRKIRYGEDDE